MDVNGTTLFATTEQGWKNTQRNEAELNRFIGEALHQLNYYRQPTPAGKLQQPLPAAEKKVK